MIQENEIVTLVLGLGLLIFVGIQRRQVRQFPRVGLFLGGVVVLLAAWVFTVAEGFCYSRVFNTLEHLGYAVSSAALALWCFLTLGQGREDHS